MLAVRDLVDHPLGVVADRIEALGDLLVALADLHGRGLLADDLVEDAGLAERARDHGDLVLVEIGDVLEQAVDGRVVGLGRNDAESV